MIARRRDSAILADQAFQLFVMCLGYAIGAAAVALVFKVAGIPLAANRAALLVLVLPLMSTCVAEAFTQLWRRTPGTLGLGGLVVFLPMLIAGAVSLAVAFGAQRFVEPFHPVWSRNSATLTTWVVLAVLCSLVALGLWRFWPEPRARLF